MPKNFGAGFASGASGISLRGLGAASTLVLLNGRRIAPFGLADDGQKVFSDLNLIPLEAVERIEILKDGGSAIYGSDAIAGVVNVILRKDYQGLAVNASYGTTQYGNGQEKRASITGGFGDLQTQGFNVLANLEVGRQGEIYNRDITDRDYIGRQDLRYLGFSANETVASISAGGNGAITTNNAAGSAINGNVRNPVTLDYYNRGNLAGRRLHAHLPRRGVQQLHEPSARRSGRRLPQRRGAGVRPDPAVAEVHQLLHARHPQHPADDAGLCRVQLVQQQERGVHDAVAGEQLGRLSGRPGQQRRGRARRRLIRTTRTSAPRRDCATSPSTTARG